jgi:hypothetical protein
MSWYYSTPSISMGKDDMAAFSGSGDKTFFKQDFFYLAGFDLGQFRHI